MQAYFKKINKASLLLILLLCNIISYSQMTSFGNTYVAGGEMVIHSNNLKFDNSNLGSLPGIIATNRSSISYYSFFGTSTWNDASDNKHIDGYAKSYNSSSFVFPIGDNGNFAPVKIVSSSSTESYSAAYFFADPSIAVTSNISGGNEMPLPIGAPFNTNNFELTLKSISPVEYWDIDGTMPAKISLSWNAKSKISELSANDLNNLVIVGWNGAKWVEIPSIIDATSILGSSSTINAGSLTSISPITPNSYIAYTFGSKTVKVPVKKDTTISVATAPIIIGTPVYPPQGGSIATSVSGPKLAGKATIDSNGVVKITPVSPLFVGKDTIRKIICITSSTWESKCDTSYIFINNQPSPVISNDRLTENTSITTATKIKDYTFEGGAPTLTISGPKNGSATLNPDGTVTYTPNRNYVGEDTVIIKRCDSKGNCVEDRFYFTIILDKNIATIIPNYFSPNGDGVNDFFDLSLIQRLYPNAKLEVYNRWGNVVYRSVGPYKNNWKGEHEMNEKPLPDGVYYYIIELGNEFSEVKTGFVEIMR